MNTNNNNIMNSTALKTYENEEDLFIKLVLNRKFINGISNIIYNFLNKDIKNIVFNKLNNKLVYYIYFNYKPTINFNMNNNKSLLLKNNYNKLIKNYNLYNNINKNKVKKDFRNTLINKLEEEFNNGITYNLLNLNIIKIEMNNKVIEENEIDFYISINTEFYYKNFVNEITLLLPKFEEYLNNETYIFNENYRQNSLISFNMNNIKDLILLNEIFFNEEYEFSNNIILLNVLNLKWNNNNMNNLKRYYIK